MTKIIPIVFLLFTSIISYAQSTISDESLEVIENTKRDFKMGFSFGINRPFLRTEGAEVSTIDEQYGLDIGLLADIGINDWFRISPRVALSFYEANIVYETPPNEKLSVYGVSSVGINTSSYFVVKRPTVDNAPYIYAGPTFRVNTKKELETSEFSTSQFNWSLDVGLGFDKDLKFFFLSPEIRYSYGMNNANLNPAFKSLKMHSLSLIFNLKD